MSNQAIAIPVHIWEQDKGIWKAWITSRKVGNLHTLADYKRIITMLYEVIDKPIAEITEYDLTTFEWSMKHAAVPLSPVTIGKRMLTARSYWRFAHEEVSVETSAVL